jgi:hypothetical protein
MDIKLLELIIVLITSPIIIGIITLAFRITQNVSLLMESYKSQNEFIREIKDNFEYFKNYASENFIEIKVAIAEIKTELSRGK